MTDCKCLERLERAVVAHAARIKYGDESDRAVMLSDLRAARAAENASPSADHDRTAPSQEGAGSAGGAVWQPIETAPRGRDTVIVLRTRATYPAMFLAYSRDGTWFGIHDHKAINETVRYWMPLPAAPAAPGVEGSAATGCPICGAYPYTPDKPRDYLYTVRKYPCGCTSAGPGDVPNYCPSHGTPPMPCDAWDSRCTQYSHQIAEQKAELDRLRRMEAWAIEAKAALERASKAMLGVTVFVTSRERIKKTEGEDWYEAEKAAANSVLAKFPGERT